MICQISYRVMPSPVHFHLGILSLFTKEEKAPPPPPCLKKGEARGRSQQMKRYWMILCEGLSAPFQCKLVPEKETLLDRAKKLYQTKLIEGTSASATILGDTTGKDNMGILPEGWALKSPKKATRFNKAPKHYLEEIFNFGQETGHKMDPTIARDMRYVPIKSPY